MFRNCVLALVQTAWLFAGVHAAELAVLDNNNWNRLAPPGKEADCILGDYVLKSDRVWAVVAQPTSWRNANMTVRQVGGCIIDLTTAEQPNDQLSAFYPGRRQYRFSKAEIVEAKGKRVVLKVTAAARPGRPKADGKPAVSGQPEVHVFYELTDGEPFLVIRSRFRNPHGQPVTVLLRDDLRADNFDAKAKNRTHRERSDVRCGFLDGLFWVHDRHFRQAYGVIADRHAIKSHSDASRYSRLEYLDPKDNSSRIRLQPGETYELVRRVIPGDSLLHVKSRLIASRHQRIMPVEFVVRDEADQPVADAEIVVKEVSGSEGNDSARNYGSARLRQEGQCTLRLPRPGEYVVTVRAPGRGSLTRTLSLKSDSDAPTKVEMVLPVAPVVIGSITDDSGQPIPCKVQFKGINGTRNPNWGPPAAVDRIVNLVYTPNGKFRVPIRPGEYEAIVSYGPEYDVVRKRLRVGPASVVRLEAVLRRVVQTPGWVSTDYHSHSSPSGDNTASQRGRVLNLLCEHIEFAPCTEHNRLDTYVPHLKALGVEKRMGTCTGIELTGSPLPLNHQNAFPLIMKPRTQDNGAPLTHPYPPSQIRRLFEWDDRSEKLVQQNHPDIGWLFFDKNGDGKIDGGYQDGFPFMHVIEVHPIHAILDMRPTRIAVRSGGKREIQNVRIFNWLQLLNQGYRIPGVVNTDAHYNFHGSGGLRNWVRCDTETPGDIDPMEIVRHSRRGHIIMSTGPFLEVSLGEAIPGDDIRLPEGKGTLHVRVQCPNWLDIDRVQVLVNGRPDPRLNFTRATHPDKFGDGVVKFDQKIALRVQEDSHFIVVAVGEQTSVGEVMGPMWGRQNPVAVSNPIYADVDGGGFQANRDTLDAPLPTKGGRPVTGGK